MVKKKIFYY